MATWLCIKNLSFDAQGENTVEFPGVGGRRRRLFRASPRAELRRPFPGCCRDQRDDPIHKP